MQHNKAFHWLLYCVCNHVCETLVHHNKSERFILLCNYCVYIKSNQTRAYQQNSSKINLDLPRTLWRTLGLKVLGVQFYLLIDWQMCSREQKSPDLHITQSRSIAGTSTILHYSAIKWASTTLRHCTRRDGTTVEWLKTGHHTLVRIVCKKCQFKKA